MWNNSKNAAAQKNQAELEKFSTRARMTVRSRRKLKSSKNFEILKLKISKKNFEIEIQEDAASIAQGPTVMEMKQRKEVGKLPDMERISLT